jgi:hypothetical protein
MGASFFLDLPIDVGIPNAPISWMRNWQGLTFTLTEIVEMGKKKLNRILSLKE